MKVTLLQEAQDVQHGKVFWLYTPGVLVRLHEGHHGLHKDVSPQDREASTADLCKCLPVVSIAKRNGT